MVLYKFKTIKTSRTGRQYENTCENCEYLSIEHVPGYSIDGRDNFVCRCAKYPAMENMVRCIEYFNPQKEL